MSKLIYLFFLFSAILGKYTISINDDVVTFRLLSYDNHMVTVNNTEYVTYDIHDEIQIEKVGLPSIKKALLSAGSYPTIAFKILEKSSHTISTKKVLPV